MNQHSTSLGGIHSDDHSSRSSESQNMRQMSSPHGQQHELTSHMDHSEGSGRKRIQRSSSSSSTDSSASGHGRPTGGRVEGPIITATQQQQQQHQQQQHQQQYVAEAAKISAGPAVVSHGGPTGGAQVVSGGSFGSVASGERRKGRFRQEYIRLPEQQQGQVRQVRHRLPTPEPDTIERIYVRRTGAEIVEEITEVPTTPPPILKERTVVEPAGPPKVVKHVIRVPPRGGSYGGQFQQQGANVHYSDNLLNAGGYDNAQQVASSYQQPGATTYSSGYNGTATTAGPYSPIGTGFSSVGGSGFGSVGGSGFGSVGASGFGSVGGSGFGSVGSGFGAVGSGFGSVGSGFGSVGRGFGSLGGSGFGSLGSGYSQQAPITFSVGGSGSSSQPMPGIGCHPAFCFYI
ncbi:unnamed protein product [Rotaria sp. Silwood1]|nr:unnamed protein product [Rotaria sp. Silwood1]